MKKLLILPCLLFVFLHFLAARHADGPSPDLQHRVWDATWITHPDASAADPAVYLFRKEFDMERVPEEFVVHVSADNRYKLFVNGRFAAEGPARGDFFKWRYESVDIAPLLREGTNVIGARVWYLAGLSPEAQFSVEPGLLVQEDPGSATKEDSISATKEDSGSGAGVNTDSSWKVFRDDACSFFPIRHLRAHYVVGPGERFDARDHPSGWSGTGFEAEGWQNALEGDPGMPMGGIRQYGNPPPRALFPRELPFMERTPQTFREIRMTEGMEVAALPRPGAPLVIPAGTKVTLLLDQGELTTAYPRLIYSGGEGSRVALTYAESLYERGKQGEVTRFKGNRDEVEGKAMIGNSDTLLCGGGEERLFEPLWWRTFRYLQLEIATADEPLVIRDIHSHFTAYPMELKAEFASGRAVHGEILEAAWLTQRLCAGETYFDCPYYEQIQYEGDTRIQGLNTFYASGDTLLWRKSIMDFYDSRLPFGLTQSRYPDNDMQLIPGYSLVWIFMVHDYWMHCRDERFVEGMLPAVEDILLWFGQRMNPNGLPGVLEGWNFVDWVTREGWTSGIPPQGEEGNSSINALQYVQAVQKAVELFRHFGRHTLAARWERSGDRTRTAVMSLCWDEERQLLADYPGGDSFSQHANILAVLTGPVPVREPGEFIRRIFRDSTLAPASYYFRYYLAEALYRAGEGALYQEMLGSWSDMLDRGLTTFLEKDEPSRSDCHAWSASPLCQFYTIICGIRPAAPGFRSITVTPCPGDLEVLEASFPHPLGEVSLELDRDGQKLSGRVTLPEGLSGEFSWNGKEVPLHPGENRIRP